MTDRANDGGFRKRLEELREADRLKSERRTGEAATSLAAEEARRQREQQELRFNLGYIEDAINASREFARHASSVGVPMNEIEVFAGTKKGLLGTKAIYTKQMGWAVIPGASSSHVRAKDSEVGGYQDYSSPSRPGISILADGTCLCGPPEKLEPLITPERYSTLARSSPNLGSFLWEFSNDYGLLRGLPQKLAEFLHSGEQR